MTAAASFSVSSDYDCATWPYIVDIWARCDEFADGRKDRISSGAAVAGRWAPGPWPAAAYHPPVCYASASAGAHAAATGTPRTDQRAADARPTQNWTPLQNDANRAASPASVADNASERN